jgi:putrescine aminotransferase
MKTKQTKNLINYKEIEDLSYSQVYSMYENHINKKKTGLLSAFGSGRVLVDKAKGARIFLKNRKNSILDLTGGFGVLNHGHNHPRILKAREYCSKNLKMEVNKSFLSPALAVLSHNICSLLPKPLNNAFFPNSGSESVDIALRLSFKYFNNKRDVILHSDIAFHGKSIGPQSISNSGENPVKIKSLIKACSFKFNSCESLSEKIEENIKNNRKCTIAAIVIEPFSASTMTESTEKFLKFARSVSEKYNILLIYDEVYTGFFKTGNFFNFLRTNKATPDMLCFAKSLGGGKSSIAGIVYSDKIQNKLQSIDTANYLSSTYYGFYEECITAIEAIQIAVDEDYEKKAQIFNEFMENLKIQIQNEFKGKYFLSGRGLLWGLFFNENKTIPKNIEILKNKVLYVSAINWLFEKKNILTALSFGKNTHIIISLNFAFTKKDLNDLSDAIFCLLKKNRFTMIPKFILNMSIKPK